MFVGKGQSQKSVFLGDGWLSPSQSSKYSFFLHDPSHNELRNEKMKLFADLNKGHSSCTS